MNRIHEKYTKTIIHELKKEFNFSNNLQVPKVTKVVINVGIGETLGKQNMMEKVIENLKIITGQKPMVNIAKKSIAGFKIREGDKVGVSVTLRGERMYDFIDRLITIVIPRLRDFRGLNDNSFDGNGNFCTGIKEHTIFPEIPYDDVEFVHGLQINISTNAKNDHVARSLLIHLGFPFKKEK